MAKFSAHTEPSSIICSDGSSSSLINTIIYFIITTLLGQLFPTLAVLISYAFIKRKLSQLDKRLNRNKSGSNFAIRVLRSVSNSIENGDMSTSKRRSENKLAKQFVIINALEVASCVFLIVVKLSNVNTVMNTDYYFIRQIFRIGSLICQAFVPIFSLLYSPAFKNVFKKVNVAQ